MTLYDFILVFHGNYDPMFNVVLIQRYNNTLVLNLKCVIPYLHLILLLSAVPQEFQYKVHVCM